MKPPKAPRRLAPGRNPSISDIIVTPEQLAFDIVDYFEPKGRLCDPARGSGPFFRAMQRYSDQVEWYEIAAGRDFLALGDPLFGPLPQWDWIICNPPWSKIVPYMKLSMRCATNVVFLITVSHMITRARLRYMDEAGFGIETIVRVPQPPAPWPSSGFQLCAVHISRGTNLPWLADKQEQRKAA